jgi:hypothetical protein
MSDLISVTDNEADPVVAYRFWDEAGGGDGHFTIAGAVQSEDQLIQSSALTDVQFVANSDAGSAIIWVQASDGQEWSDWASLQITTTAGA